MIGGNTTGTIQVCDAYENEIGEAVKAWASVQALWGWLDLSGGDSRYTTYNAKMQESTHLFICDYTELDTEIKAENSRMIINGQMYDILLIDDPMGKHKHLEFYLKYTGGQ